MLHRARASTTQRGLEGGNKNLGPANLGPANTARDRIQHAKQKSREKSTRRTHAHTVPSNTQHATKTKKTPKRELGSVPQTPHATKTKKRPKRELSSASQTPHATKTKQSERGQENKSSSTARYVLLAVQKGTRKQAPTHGTLRKTNVSQTHARYAN